MKKIGMGIASLILALVVIRTIGIIMTFVFKIAVVAIIAAVIYFSFWWMFRKEE